MSHVIKKLAKPLAALVSLTLLTLYLISLQPKQAQGAENYQLYLPMVAKGSTATTPPPPPPPTQVKGSFFVDDQFKTSSAGIQVDAQGGMHLVYYYYEPAIENRPTNGVYLYCPGGCEKPASWSGVAMGELVNEIQLQLTPAGQPRIVFRTLSQARPNGNDYYYAACDQQCTDPSKWGLIYLTSSSGIGVIDLDKDDKLPQRYFALDANGRPRFIYNDGVTDHIGTYYAYCDSGCLNPDSWFETKINKDNGNQGPFRDENFYYPALAFTPQGQPRVVADGVSMQDEFFLFYLACDANCQLPSSWQSAPLYDRGSGPNVSYDIEIDGNGRPRVAFYEGAKLGGQGDRLFYAWCNGSCLNSGNWQRKDLGLGSSDGRGPDLELTAAGKPRLAYALYNAGGLGYSWCNNNCESTTATWQHQVSESRSALYQAWPVVYPEHCDGGLWDGIAPTLALDSAGNPRIAYDTTYHARCWYNPDTGEWDPWSEFRLVQRAARLLFFPQP
ncbi:MAG: hypothetical protein CL608_21550 [Anaerolineaceae bacterium]|nr:hypothetical protein [Anaerolineaceae bacterium]